jgi:hypothetical protein
MGETEGFCFGEANENSISRKRRILLAKTRAEATPMKPKKGAEAVQANVRRAGIIVGGLWCCEDWGWEGC